MTTKEATATAAAMAKASAVAAAASTVWRTMRLCPEFMLEPDDKAVDPSSPLS
ncbi:hypothetical protein GRAN_1615 [Granulicella sibirica]|uniref:Uncharacterized protein n=1 Tax=Granulicella sibirica TaxID=2479048 RepID=A0A4Q0T3L5_9BACT|nr:hypothetical protein GRAN_1615 [Granulicella sibirica]